MKEMPPLIALDIETTGLLPETGERICEIALLKIQKGKIIDEFVSLLNPEKPISLGASTVSGITDEMVKDSPTFKEIAENILIF